MNKRLLCKYFVTLGLLLFFTLFMPIAPFHETIAQAGNLDKEKNYDYRLNLKSITLVKEKSFTLRVYNLGEGAKVNFKSDDSEIASVNEDGLIKANKVGSTIITATIKDGLNSTSLTCDITVGPPAFSVKITKSRIILGLDKMDLLRVILKPSNTAEVARFSSYDSNIASVSIGGRVTAKKLGLTYLFAEIDAVDNDGSRKFAVCTIIITSPDNAPLLETYFNEHPELDLIPTADLSSALEEFFNGKPGDTGAPIAQTEESSLIKSLNKFLDKKFNLDALRSQREAAISKSTQNQVEVVSDNSTK